VLGPDVVDGLARDGHPPARFTRDLDHLSTVAPLAQAKVLRTPA
jgi:hypothetical protein